ncbi:DUF6234 family protein [Streptomyces mesophilus]|uniref:DUF6234 family protein n=1 Tax=Streptomyces mesophilus TaxID=1775132 RepID=UPI003EB7EA4D
MPAWWWSADIALAVVLVLLDGAALAVFCIAEGIKKWAAEGGHVEGADRRLWMVLTIGPAGLAAVSYATFQAGLLVTALSQALIGLALQLPRVLAAASLLKAQDTSARAVTAWLRSGWMRQWVPWRRRCSPCTCSTHRLARPTRTGRPQAAHVQALDRGLDLVCICCGRPPDPGARSFIAVSVKRADVPELAQAVQPWQQAVSLPNA